jgi:plastocyanin
VKSTRTQITWVMRAAMAAGIIVLLVAALGNQFSAQPPAPTLTATPVQIAALPPPTAIATFRPTATSQPFVERVTSHVSRDTPAPYPTSTPGPDSETVVSAVDFGYLPGVVRIHVGQTVAWTNDGQEAHDVTGDDGWYSGQLTPTVSYRHVFGFAGTFAYHCTIHLDMHGTVIVVP